MNRALALLPLLLAACSDLPDPGDPLDHGGSVLTYAAHIEWLDHKDEEFRVPADCRSACTMYLGLDTACFDPAGRLGFHSTTADGAFNGILARHYRADRAAWFLAPGGPGSSKRVVYVPAADLIASGEARACRSRSSGT